MPASAPRASPRFVNLEGFGMAPDASEQAPKRYARWLEELREPPRLRPYEGFSALADRLQQGNKRLSRERARVPRAPLGPGSAGKGVALRGDPAHKIVNPVLYRYEEVRACWEQVARAGAVGRGRRVRNAEAAAPERRAASPSAAPPSRICGM